MVARQVLMVLSPLAVAQAVPVVVDKAAENTAAQVVVEKAAAEVVVVTSRPQVPHKAIRGPVPHTYLNWHRKDPVVVVEPGALVEVALHTHMMTMVPVARGKIGTHKGLLRAAEDLLLGLAVALVPAALADPVQLIRGVAAAEAITTSMGV